MVINARDKQSDLIKMKSGKKELPIGIYSRKSGGYELRRTANGQRYHFGTVHNLELALTINNGLDKVIEDYRTEVNSNKNKLETLVAENQVGIEGLTSLVVTDGLQNVLELSRQLNELREIMREQERMIINQSNLLSKEIYRTSAENLSKRKLTWKERLTGRLL